MNSEAIQFQRLEKEMSRRVDRNSLFLLLLLTVPAVAMGIVLFLWPDVFWIAGIPYAVIGVLGAFATILLSIFLINRYRSHPRIFYLSSGLMALGIIDGFRALSSPGSSEYVWLHSLASVAVGVFFLLYIISEKTRFPVPSMTINRKMMAWWFGGAAASAFLVVMLTTVFVETLPAIVQYNRFTPVAWMANAIPIGLFLIVGIYCFRQYRKTGAHELFLYTAILTFLFQASEVFFFATIWSVIWWFWQALQLAIYLAVLGYVLREYIQTSDSLTVEINERKKIEETLRKADDDWRDSFNSLEEIMVIMDKDYKIENINSSGLAFLGKEKEAVIGERCYQSIHNKDQHCAYCPFQESLKSKKAASIERYDDLRGQHFFIKAAPIFDEQGEIIKFVYLMSDITERIKAAQKESMLQEELTMTSRLASIGEVASGIAHEINNPLTGVIAFAEMLKQMDVPENIIEAVEVINDGAVRVAGIVEKLLTFARQTKPGKEYMDINAVIKNNVEMRAYEMRTTNVKTTMELATDLPKTMANMGQLRQVFLNIIINAEQAMGKGHRGGNLHIKTEKATQKMIRVSFADDGPGINKDDIDKIFDPFFTTKGSSGGTGLGLSVSYGIIKEHGGKIFAESSAGMGTTFFIDLPIIAESKQPVTPEPSNQEPDKIKVSAAEIMVVDDEPQICRALERLLTANGHKVDAFSHAQTALQRLQVAKYDLILLDIRMPGMSGIEFYHHLKEIDPSLQQKVICITGDIISARNKTFLKQAGIPCVTKPFGIEALMSLVKTVLGGETDDAQVTYSYC